MSTAEAAAPAPLDTPDEPTPNNRHIDELECPWCQTFVDCSISKIDGSIATIELAKHICMGERQSRSWTMPAHVDMRHRLPDERQSITHRFNIAGHKGYFHVGMFPDGRPGELFITMAKQGSTVSGLMDSVALLFSLLLQFGVPLGVIVEKLRHRRFEPSGCTENQAIPMTVSTVDYIATWFEQRFLKTVSEPPAPALGAAPTPAPRGGFSPTTPSERWPARRGQSDAPSCRHCGTITVPSGACYKCPNCGETTGCA